MTHEEVYEKLSNKGTDIAGKECMELIGGSIEYKRAILFVYESILNFQEEKEVYERYFKELFPQLSYVQTQPFEAFFQVKEGLIKLTYQMAKDGNAIEADFSFADQTKNAPEEE